MGNRELKLLRFTGFCLFGYLLLLALKNRDTFNEWYIIAIGTLVWVIAKYALLRPNQSVRSVNVSILAIVLVGGILRFLWAVYVPTRPVSDFRIYHEFALNFSQGNVEDWLPKNPGYSLLLSLGYRIEPSVITGKLINAGLSTLTIYLVFLIGRKLSSRAAGLLAAFLFAILPAEINMVSVLGTEVAAATLLTATTLAFIQGVCPMPNLRWIFFSGFLLGIGFSIRSSLLFYVPAFLGYLIFTRHLNIVKRLIQSLVYTTGAVAFLLLLAIWHSASIGKPSLEALQMRDAYPFLSGTNILSDAGWNETDAALYFSWPVESRDRLAVREAFRRVLESPGKYLLFLPRRYELLMGSNIYGNSWSIHPIQWNYLGKLRHLRPDFLEVNKYLNQSVYILLLALACYYFIDYRWQSPGISATATLAVVLLLIPHAILEIQSRYHHPILPFISLVAGSGLLSWVKIFARLPVQE